MLLIPLQGIAATVMLGCGATTFGNTSSSHTSTVHPHHEDEAVHSVAPFQDAQHAQEEVALDSHSDHGKCSACASCCTGALIVNMQIELDINVSGTHFIPFILQSFANHTPEGLDPPPRAFLA